MNIRRPLAIGATLSSFDPAAPADAAAVGRALAKLADDSFSGLDGNGPLIDRIEAFQRANALRPDGIMRPGGVTERLINTALWERDAGAGQRERPVLPLGATVGFQGDNRAPDVNRAGEALIRAGYLDGTISDLVYRGDEQSFRDAILDDLTYDPRSAPFINAIVLLQRGVEQPQTGRLAPNSRAHQVLERLARPSLLAQATGAPAAPTPATPAAPTVRDRLNARGWGGPRGDYQIPNLPTEAERRASILADTPGRITVAPNPDAKLVWWKQRPDTPAPIWEDHYRGHAAVKRHEKIIDEEAARAGVDANLLKAIVYTENARGHYAGLEGTATAIRKIGMDHGIGWLKELDISADTILPMNINPELWGELGIEGMDVFDARKNIRAGARLVRRITDRTGSPTPENVYTLYNALAADKVREPSAYLRRIYDMRKWEIVPPLTPAKRDWLYRQLRTKSSR
jgi:hypothetical protein